MDASKNQFHNGIEFSQVIESMDSMPGARKSLKIKALAPLEMCKDDIYFVPFSKFCHQSRGFIPYLRLAYVC